MSGISSISVLLADDEAGMRLILRKKIQAMPGFEIIGEAADGEEALRLFDAHRPRVVFLDVDMPGKTGIECARLMQDQDPTAILIFATGHEEYRSEAFEVYAFDYLVKPFRLERLEGTLRRIQALLTQEAPKGKAPLPPAPAALPGRMLLRRRDGVTFLNLSDILLIQREERATVLYTLQNRRYVLHETLSELEARLDNGIFFRCHKSYIVNLNHIRDITPYGRWTFIIRLNGTEHDALITHEKYEELEKRFQ